MVNSFSTESDTILHNLIIHRLLILKIKKTERDFKRNKDFL